MAIGIFATRSMRAILPLLTLAAVTYAPISSADSWAQAWDGNWHSELTVYGWLPGVDAEIAVPVDTGTAVSKSNNDILSNLKGALMFEGDVRKGDWGFYGNVDWVKFGNQTGRFRDFPELDGAVNLSTEWNLKGGMVTLAGLYNITHGPSGYTDFIFGGRYLWVKTNVKWDFVGAGDDGGAVAASGRSAQNSHFSNGIIGIRGRWQSSDSGWYVPYYADIGTGDSDLTSMLDLGVGYAFGWGDLGFDWRYVYYDQGHDEFVRHLELTGPSISLTWHF